MIERGDRGGPSPEASGGGEMLLGREREMAALRAALASASSGRGRLVLLSGEAGIGKTRLADTFAAEAREGGARVAWGRCWEAGGAPVYWPWVQAVRSLLRDVNAADLRRLTGPDGPYIASVLPEVREVLPELPELADSESDRARFQLFDSFSRLLRTAARDGPIVLILDDLHAADEPSLLLLRFVSMDLAESGIVVLAIYREGELVPNDPRIGLLAEVARVSAAERLDPPGLTVEEVAHYIRSAGSDRPPEGLAEAVYRETEGNPLFVGEIVRMLAEEGRLGRAPDAPDQPLGVTEGVKAVIGRRLARLSDPCRELLARASVIGVEIPIDLVVGLEGRPASQLMARFDEAVAAHVLMEPRTSGGTWRFAHALIRDVLYASLPGSVRRDLHLRMARTLEAQPDAGATARGAGAPLRPCRTCGRTRYCHRLRHSRCRACDGGARARGVRTPLPARAASQRARRSRSVHVAVATRSVGVTRRRPGADEGSLLAGCGDCAGLRPDRAARRGGTWIWRDVPLDARR